MLQNNKITVIKQSEDFSYGLCSGDMVKVNKIDFLKAEPITIPHTIYAYATSYYQMNSEDDRRGELWIEMDEKLFSSYGFRCYYTCTDTYYDKETGEMIKEIQYETTNHLLKPLNGTHDKNKELAVFPDISFATFGRVWDEDRNKYVKVVTRYDRKYVSLFNKYTGEEYRYQYNFNHPIIPTSGSGSYSKWYKTEDAFTFTGCDKCEVVY